MPCLGVLWSVGITLTRLGSYPQCCEKVCVSSCYVLPCNVWSLGLYTAMNTSNPRPLPYYWCVVLFHIVADFSLTNNMILNLRLSDHSVTKIVTYIYGNVDVKLALQLTIFPCSIPIYLLDLSVKFMFCYTVICTLRMHLFLVINHSRKET